MIEISVCRYPNNVWLATFVGQPTSQASGTSANSACVNLLLKYGLTGLPANVVAVYNGTTLLNFDYPLSVTIPKDSLL